MHRNKFLEKLADFTLITFICLFTVSFGKGNIIKLLFSWGKRSISPSLTESTFLPFVIIWPIVYRIPSIQNIYCHENLVAYVLWKISFIHLKYKSQSLSKKVIGENDTITAAIFAFLLICACAKFISKYAHTWKYVNIIF